MKGKNTKRIKSRIMHKFVKSSSMSKRSNKRTNKRTNKRSNKRTNRRQKGGMIPYPAGYSQYQNNLPMTPSYSVGGILSSNNLGLANPPPYKVLSNCTNCTDNYNHYTGKGFPSRGH